MELTCLSDAPFTSTPGGGLDEPGFTLTASVYQPPVSAQPNKSLPQQTFTLRSTNADPFICSNTQASLARRPSQQRSDIKSLVESRIPSRPRPLVHPETLIANQVWTMPDGSNVPQPGPARISKGGGPDEWLEAAKQCKYLPEAIMKQLCEIVKENLMEGKLSSGLFCFMRGSLPSCWVSSR